MAEGVVAGLEGVVREVSGVLGGLWRRAREYAERLGGEGLLGVVEECPGPSVEGLGGVDGWFGRVFTVLSLSIYAYRVVGVGFRGGRATLVFVEEDVVWGRDVEASEDTGEKALFEMMLGEARAAAALAERGYTVFLDGPVVDPPRLARSPLVPGGGLGYHRERARLLAVARPVGYVKRVLGESLLAPLLGLSRGVGDGEAATAILGAVLSGNPGACAAYIGPLEPRGGLYREVYLEAGLRLRVYYVRTRWWPWARRVEEPSVYPRGFGVEKTLAATPPGAQHPLPVQAAHGEAGRLAGGLDALRSLAASRLLHDSPGLAESLLLLGDLGGDAGH